MLDQRRDREHMTRGKLSIRSPIRWLWKLENESSLRQIQGLITISSLTFRLPEFNLGNVLQAMDTIMVAIRPSRGRSQVMCGQSAGTDHVYVSISRAITIAPDEPRPPVDPLPPRPTTPDDLDVSIELELESVSAPYGKIPYNSDKIGSEVHTENELISALHVETSFNFDDIDSDMGKGLSPAELESTVKMSAFIGRNLIRHRLLPRWVCRSSPTIQYGERRHIHQLVRPDTDLDGPIIMACYGREVGHLCAWK